MAGGGSTRTARVAPDYDVIVVGAGIVGLATAARLAGRVGSLLLVERHEGICRETSSRSSEVIHAGIYYPPGSLKARTCVRGKHLLYARCARLGIAAARVGKLIVAVDDAEAARLAELARRAEANGVDDLEGVDGAGIRRRNGELPGVAALWSPSTGVMDSHAYAASFLAEARAGGADVAFRTSVLGAERVPGGYAVRTRGAGDADAWTVTARVVVNAAGLGQDRLSAAVGIDVEAAGYRQYPCKGDWFAIAPRHRGRVGCLVYPVGSARGGGLGVHLCLDVGGGMRLGPDSEWCDEVPSDLSVDPGKAAAFWEVGRRLLPWLDVADLTPDQAGVRAKLVPGPGLFRDFVVAEESARELPGWVTVAGIESPGLTAGVALAEEVERVLVQAGVLDGTTTQADG